MNYPPTPRSHRRARLIALLLGAVAAGSDLGASSPSAPTQGGAFEARGLWEEQHTPLDYLDKVGQNLKARWRQHYRPPPPVPAPERGKLSLTLGALIGESFLACEAGDAQQFRNNQQEVMTFCKTLGLGERVTPRLMAQAKMAEMEQWPELRSDMEDGMVQLLDMLHSQRDEDLAILVELGAWLRTLEVASAVVLDDPNPENLNWCIGCSQLLEHLLALYGGLSDTARQELAVMDVGATLDFLRRHWLDVPSEVPPQIELATKTLERLTAVMRRTTLK
ncbi:MAG: hypothetical protein KDK99_21260 [Verrucomicrobiales bacterium]|nr:hypothetical protein [Verrucomicrobiales bacterium]